MTETPSAYGPNPEPQLPGDTAAAIAFLQLMYPDDPWHIVAMSPNGKPVAKTFGRGEAREATGWIGAHQGVANVYFHVNRLRAGVSNVKAKKDDMLEAVFLHVDIDDYDARERLERFVPKPTSVVFSGGGYQAFWRLRAPIPIADAERVNKAIAADLGGDKCHNGDRVMRLPGTINVPDARKRRKGRVPVLAYLVEGLCGWYREFDIQDFSHISGPILAITIPKNIQVTRVRLEELPPTIPPLTRNLILHGDDPERPIGSENARYPSRSEPVFRVACDLLEAGCSPERVVSVLVSPDFGISRSVLEKATPEKYALKQVQSAAAALQNGWPDVDRSGRPRPTFRNTLVALPRLGLTFEYDEFHRRKVIGGARLDEFVGEISDDTCAVARRLILDHFDFNPGRDHVREAINTLCLDNIYHPVREYLKRLKWDGIPRLAGWLTTYLGTPKTVLTDAIGKIVLVAAVRRVRHPGTKFDTVMVIEGPQGSGKSTALQLLAGDENFSDQDILALDPKTQMEALEGIWIFELGELSGISRADTNKVKAFVSRSVDRGRPAYGRFRENRPRQVVFIGTSNDDRYLRDQTGNRRFWPVQSALIDIEALRRDRDQLWAEAAMLEAAGAGIVLPQELWSDAQVVQESRLEDDPWFEALFDVTGDKVGEFDRVSSKDLLAEYLRIPAERQQAYHPKRLAIIMKKLGWDGPKPMKMLKGNTARGYERLHDEANAVRQRSPKPDF